MNIGKFKQGPVRQVGRWKQTKDRRDEFKRHIYSKTTYFWGRISITHLVETETKFFKEI